ncbi:MAG: N4-gp56 family major capsid protein [Cyanobacteria bacterium]|nr:N4-gp56 family major capsid protein [Cyanobacteriota bacterium]
MPDTLGTLSATAKQFYDRLLLSRALPTLYLPKIGQARNIPENSGNQVSFRRLNSLAAATTPLVEGITPAAVSLSMTEVTVTAQQYGNYVQISDAVNLMGVDPVLQEATNVLGENGGQSIEEIVKAELVSGTNVIYATGSARNAQSAANPMTSALVRRAVRTLAANDSRPFSGSEGENGLGGLFIGYIHPRQWFDLLGDTAVLNTFQYSDPQRMYTLNLPTFNQVAWIVSTRAPLFAGQGSGAADVYGCLIFGQEAFGYVNMGNSQQPQSGKLNTIVQPLGSAGSADPLSQRGSVAWKSFQAPKILNNNFFVRVETGVTA